jgi:hypothetical protein
VFRISANVVRWLERQGRPPTEDTTNGKLVENAGASNAVEGFRGRAAEALAHAEQFASCCHVRE